MPSVIPPAPAQQSINTTKSLPAAAMPLISPSALLQAHLTQDPPLRPSGRLPSQTRQIDLNIGSLTHCNGSSVVKIGNTTVVCGVRGEILPVTEIPSYSPEKKSQSSSQYSGLSQSQSTYSSPSTQSATALYNLLVPNLDLSTGCSPLHAPNTAPTSQAQSLTQRLYTLLHTTNLVPSSTLEIRYTPSTSQESATDPDDPSYIPPEETQNQLKAYWTLYIDMVCISYGGEGSVFDASWFAMLAALKDTILPKAWWDEDDGVVLCDPATDQARNLETRGLPVPLSFGVFEAESRGLEQDSNTSKTWILLDQDTFEDESCAERGCVVVDCSDHTLTDAMGKKRRKIVRIEKSGGGVVDVKTIKDVVTQTEKRWAEWDGVLSRALAAAAKARS